MSEALTPITASRRSSIQGMGIESLLSRSSSSSRSPVKKEFGENLELEKIVSFDQVVSAAARKHGDEKKRARLAERKELELMKVYRFVNAVIVSASQFSVGMERTPSLS